MAKDTKKKKNTLYLILSDKAAKNLNDKQADRQKADGFRTPIKVIANELLEKA